MPRKMQGAKLFTDHNRALSDAHFLAKCLFGFESSLLNVKTQSQALRTTSDFQTSFRTNSFLCHFPLSALLSFFAFVFMCWLLSCYSGYELSRHELLLLSRGVQDQKKQRWSLTVDSLGYNAIINSSQLTIINLDLKYEVMYISCECFFFKKEEEKCSWDQKVLKVYEYFSMEDDK